MTKDIVNDKKDGSTYIHTAKLQDKCQILLFNIVEGPGYHREGWHQQREETAARSSINSSSFGMVWENGVSMIFYIMTS